MIKPCLSLKSSTPVNSAAVPPTSLLTPTSGKPTCSQSTSQKSSSRKSASQKSSSQPKVTDHFKLLSGQLKRKFNDETDKTKNIVYTKFDSTEEKNLQTESRRKYTRKKASLLKRHNVSKPRPKKQFPEPTSKKQDEDEQKQKYAAIMEKKRQLKADEKAAKEAAKEKKFVSESSDDSSSSGFTVGFTILAGVENFILKLFFVKIMTKLHSVSSVRLSESFKKLFRHRPSHVKPTVPQIL